MTQPIHLFVDHLTVMDFSYLHPTRGIVGESWIVDVELIGTLDKQGMIMDFGHVKKDIKHAIDSTLDHSLLVPMQLQGLEWEVPRCAFRYTNNKGWFIRHESPQEAMSLIDSAVIDEDSVTAHLLQQIERVVPSNVGEIRLTLRSDNNKDPYYHYSHGLKKHDGNCQRIAHGHRSPIHVYLDNRRNRDVEVFVADAWADAYVVTEEDITQRETHAGIEHLTVAYDAPQGHFSITLPEPMCVVMQKDSTVEHIAEYLAQICKQRYPSYDIKVKAFEGVQKGAIATA